MIYNLGQKFATDEQRDEFYRPITDYIRENGHEIVIRNGEEENDELCIRSLQGVTGVIFSSNGPAGRAVLDRLPDLRFIVRYGIGLNSVDLEYCTQTHRPVFYTPGYCVKELGIHAVTLGMAVLRNLHYYDSNLRKGIWLKGNGPLPVRPGNMTVGLFGYGASGHEIAKIMKGGFGSRIIAFDPYVDRRTMEAEETQCVDFRELCRTADMIFIVAPLTEKTHHIFDRRAFSEMKPNVIIVNISRGPIIDSSALEAALSEKRIYGAGLDVFEEEPVPVSSGLNQMENVVMTPHAAFYGKESVHTANYLLGHIVIDFINNKTVYRKHLANKEMIPYLEKEGYLILDELTDY